MNDTNSNPFAALGEADRTTLRDALSLAIERYHELAETAKAEATPVTGRGKSGAPAMFSKTSMSWIADQLQHQANAARRLRDLIEGAAA
jgi:hypothetical protein